MKPVEELSHKEMFEELNRAVEVLYAAIEYGTLSHAHTQYVDVLKMSIKYAEGNYLAMGLGFLNDTR